MIRVAAQQRLFYGDSLRLKGKQFDLDETSPEGKDFLSSGAVRKVLVKPKVMAPTPTPVSGARRTYQRRDMTAEKIETK